MLTSLLVMILSACSADEFDMGPVDIKQGDLVEGVAFSITPDAENPNIIHLKSLMPANYHIAWEHPQGRSTDNECTLRIPFEGDYEVKIGVETRGGYVWGAPATFHVSQMCAEFISNPLWTVLTGGVDCEKTWMFNINAERKCLPPFISPLWFMTGGYAWDHLHNAAGDNYVDADVWDAESAIDPSMAGQWYWSADYAGNDWMCAAQDYGTITFDLKGGAHITTVNDMEGTKKGNYMLDADKHTLGLSGIELYPIDGRLAGVKSWNILYMNDNWLQICDPVSGVAVNLVSKDYYDNYQEPDEEVKLPSTWADDILVIMKGQPVNYSLNAGAAYGLATAGGNVIGDLKASSAKVNLTLNSYKNTYTCGDVSGTFTYDKEGVFTFSDGLGVVDLGGATFAADKDSQLKLLKYEIGTGGYVSDVWFGAKTVDEYGAKTGYTVYHFNSVVGGAVIEYDAQMYITEIGNWKSVSSPVTAVSASGTYSVTYTGAASELDGDGKGEIHWYVDLFNVLKDHPNAKCQILSVSYDGKEYSYDASLTDSDARDGGNPDGIRMQLKNAWGTGIPLPDFTQSITVSFSVNFND